MWNDETKTFTIPYNNKCKLDYLPENTKILIFEENLNIKEYSQFNSSVDNLPKSLQHLQLGTNFNKPVENLPESLQYLMFGEKFNRPVDNLPEVFATFNLWI